MYKKYKISLILPCFNEEEGLQCLLPRVPEFIDEIIVVDNNSTDKSVEAAQRFKRVKIVREPVQGYGSAYKRGFKEATGDIIVTMDSDCSYPVESTAPLLDYFLEKKIDFLSGARFPLKDKTAMETLNKIGNKFFTLLFFFFTLRPIKDAMSGMWIFKKEILKQMNLKSDGISFTLEIKLEAVLNKSVSFGEQNIDYRQRLGRVKMRKLKDGFLSLGLLFKKRAEIALRNLFTLFNQMLKSKDD
jgi:hypothetical protein